MDKIFFKLCWIAWLLLARNTHMEHKYHTCLQNYNWLSLANMMLQPSISIKLVLLISKWGICWRKDNNRGCCTYRITEWLMLGGTSESHLVQPPCSSRATQPQLPRTVSRQLLNTPNDRDPRTPLGNLLQYFVNLRVKKCFVMFRGNLLCFSLFLLPLVLSLEPGSVLFVPSLQTSIDVESSDLSFALYSAMYSRIYCQIS